MESILETKAAAILEFFAGLRGTLWVTFEEGTWSVWLYDLLNPRVDKLVVCNPRKNALLKDGNKSDRIDARKLAELLRGNQLKPVYHGETGMRMLRELSRSYHRQRSVAGYEPAESGVSQLGDSLCGQRCLLSSTSSAVAGQDRGSGGAASSRTTL
jgi:transposase